LEDFQKLKDKTINWNSGASGYGSCSETTDEDDLTFTGIFEPVVKKKKTS